MSLWQRKNPCTRLAGPLRTHSVAQGLLQTRSKAKGPLRKFVAKTIAIYAIYF
jgi:hypothetical protein